MLVGWLNGSIQNLFKVRPITRNASNLNAVSATMVAIRSCYRGKCLGYIPGPWNIDGEGLCYDDVTCWPKKLPGLEIREHENSTGTRKSNSYRISYC